MKINIIGCGSIGTELARALEKMDDIDAIYISDKRKETVKELVKSSTKIRYQREPKAVMERVDMVIEAASQDAARKYVPMALEKGKDVLMMSVGALVDDEFRAKCRLIAKKNRCRLYIPSGALAGIDGLAAASCGRIDEVLLISYKPPEAFKGVRYLEDRRVDLDSLERATIIFEGHARDAVRYFPKNINVAATVSLAGIGFEKTKVRLVADPSARMNTHRLIVKGDIGEIEVSCRNLPSPTNPKTSLLAALSAISAVKKAKENVWVGA
ncbi:MAG: aspartate dehydrogenase [Thermoplasmata archaeon]